MKFTCPKSSQGCQTGDYQIKVINKVPRPEEPNFDWLKPTLFDRLTSVGLPIFLGISWVCILGAILFS